MKNHLIILSIITTAALFTHCSSNRTVFTEELEIALKSETEKPENFNLRMANEGYYSFGYCTDITVICNAQVRWFRECDGPVEVATVGLVFIDSARAMFFINPDKREKINLKDPGSKGTKIGFYYWDKKAAADSVNTNGPLLVIRIKDTKLDKHPNNFSDLYFDCNNESLTLVKMTYFEADHSYVDLLPKSNSKGEDPDDLIRNLGDNSGQRTLLPNENFSFKKSTYYFSARPISLTIGDDMVIGISYDFDASISSYVRRTQLVDKPALNEVISSDSIHKKTIKTW